MHLRLAKQLGTAGDRIIIDTRCSLRAEECDQRFIHSFQALLHVETEVISRRGLSQ